MELNKSIWTKQDCNEFQEYLLTFSKGKDKANFEQRIVNTKLPCIAVQSPDVKKIATQILRGNFLSFLDCWLWENHTNTTINGFLICKIKDFDLFKRYLDKYAEYCDNWATCDTLKFPFKEFGKQKLFELSKQYTQSSKPFKRRIGFLILFGLIDDNEYIDKIFEIMNSFYDEQEYYVNMIIAWLFAECFVKQREKTLIFLQDHKLNRFAINKGISKCRDSFRISNQDKDMLVSFKK